MNEEKTQINPWAQSPEEKELRQKSNGGMKIANMKFQEGDTTIRIVGAYFFYEEHWMFKVKRTVICPRKQCPVCNHPDKEKFKQAAEPLKVEAEKVSNKLGKTNDKTKAAWRAYFTAIKSDQFEPRFRYAVNVIDRKTGEMNIWRFSPTMKDSIENIIKKWGDPTTYDLVVTRKGTGFRHTKYSVSPPPQSPELTEAEKALKPFRLSILFKTTSLEKVNAYLEGHVPERRTASETAEEQVTELPSSVEKDLDPGDVGDLGDLGDI